MIHVFSKRRGFTLIELLVVIAIIGILASVVLASLNSARRKSRDVRRIADIKQIKLALDLYFDAAKGPDGSGTSASYPGGTDPTAMLVPTYISVLPKDPSTLAIYAYQGLDDDAGGACASGSATTCNYYHLGAFLEEDTNLTLSNDSDKEPAATWGFDGDQSVACGADAAGTDQCYDVTP